MIGKRTSAFAPYQKPESNPPTSSNSDVFVNAPFQNKSRSKQRNDTKKSTMTDIERRQFSSNDPTIDNYF